ncbi:MAG TPA: hypothetical protein VGN63_23020 [Flavisolibacter sp.]|jgi:flagellar biosynthesis protein FliQ|nr:hypothetical protein [Flavisolibacter sp.]
MSYKSSDGPLGIKVVKASAGLSLILIGLVIIYLIRNSQIQNSTLDFILIISPTVLIVAGIIFVFIDLQRDAISPSKSEEELESDLNKAVSQLSKNYDILRKQTIYGFTISGIFMTIGLVVILIGITGEFFNLEGNIQIITTASGVVIEFISGTALLLYRINFKRLNDTSDKLLSTWKLLTAFEKVNEISPNKKDEVLIRLIDKLTDDSTATVNSLGKITVADNKISAS